jgi:RNA polymerase sigma factor (sigma-70 family)
MANAADRIPLRFLRALAMHPLSDGELLRRYLTAGEEDAFAEIVRRNGPLVLRACRHVLGETTAAEDAFQATFLLLARKGRGLPPAGSLAGWLHVAAVRIAGDARRAEWRRRRRESAAGARPPARSPFEELTWREVCERLDAELAALPEKYRLPLVLCYLQELSYEEAARRAGCSTGALRGRLERGKKILRKRLARYGLPLSAPVLVLGQPLSVPATLCQATLATVRSALSGGTVPAAVGALAGPAISFKAKMLSAAGVLVAVFGFAWASLGQSYREATTTAAPERSSETLSAAPPQRGVDGRGDRLPPGAVARFGTRRFQMPASPQPISVRDGKAYLVYLPGQLYHGRAEFRWLDASSGKVLDTWLAPQGPLFDAETGRPMPGSTADPNLVSLAPDGRWAVFTDKRVIFTGLRVRQVKPDRSFNFYIYDLAARKRTQHLRGQLEEPEWLPSSACISADGKWLASTGKHVRLWDVNSGKQVWFRKQAAQATELLGFTPGGKNLILYDSNGAIVVVDTAGAKIVRTIATGFTRRRRGTLLAPDGKSVVMRLVEPGETVIWDLDSGKQLPPLQDRGKSLTAWVFSPDGKTIVCAESSSGTRVVVRDWPSRKVRRRFDLGRSGVASTFVSADNRTLNVLFHQEQTLHRYDLESGKPLPVPGETHRGGVIGVEVAPDGSIVSLGSDRVLRTWDLASGRQTRQASLNWAPAETPFALGPDGKSIALADYYGSGVAIFDRDGKIVRRLDAAKQGIDHVVFSPSGRLLAATGRGAGIARIWETATWKTVAQLSAGKGVWWSPTVDIAFSHDDRYFAATTEGKVQFWDTGGWRAVEGLPEHASGMAFSPDSRLLACGSGPDTAVWEVSTRKLRFKVRSAGVAWNWSQRFSPDGRLLARLTSNDAVEVWDVVRGQQVATFQGHDSAVKAFAFTPDGAHIITASSDCTLLAWDVASAVAAARAGQKCTAPTEKDLADSWNNLSSPDAQKAFAAIRTLVEAPERAIKLIRARVKAPAPLDVARVRRLLTDLDSDTFAVRARATRELQALGEMAEMPIRRLLAGKPSLEATRRAERLLDAIIQARRSGEQLRAVEVLERIGNEEAREVLRQLSKGPPEAFFTQDAAAALRRMESRR